MDGPLFLPMQFTEVDLSQVDDLVESPAWVFEQKFDGTRGLCVITEKSVWWPARDGIGDLNHAAATQHFATLNPVLFKLMENSGPGELVLDGEIIVGTGEYFVWDIAYLIEDGTVLINPANSDLKTRRHILESLFERLPVDGPVKLVRQAKGSADKSALWNAVRSGGGEGVMAKRLDSNYDIGKRVKHTLKLKFVKTADVIVLAVNRPDKRHGSFILGVHAENGKTICIGACSAIGKDPEVKVGDVIEIAYLYWTGKSVYQPRMLKIRDDKPSKDCHVSQFPEYNRSAY